MKLHKFLQPEGIEFPELDTFEITPLILMGQLVPCHDYKRDDGLDDIVEELENDPRTCEVDMCDHALLSADRLRQWEGHSDSLWQQRAAHK